MKPVPLITLCDSCDNNSQYDSPFQYYISKLDCFNVAMQPMLSKHIVYNGLCSIDLLMKNLMKSTSLA